MHNEKEPKIIMKVKCDVKKIFNVYDYQLFVFAVVSVFRHSLAMVERGVLQKRLFRHLSSMVPQKVRRDADYDEMS
jgi:hypothetical protein